MGWLLQIFCISAIILFFAIVQIMKRLAQVQAARNAEARRASGVSGSTNLHPARTFDVRTHESTMVQHLDVSKITYTEPPPPYPGLPNVRLPDPPSYDELPGSTNGGSAQLSRPPSEHMLPLKQ